MIYWPFDFYFPPKTTTKKVSGKITIGDLTFTARLKKISSDEKKAFSLLT